MRSEASRLAKCEYDRLRRQDPEYRAMRKTWKDVYGRTDRGWAARRLAEVRCRARKLRIEFALTTKDLQLPKVCPVFGTPLVIGRGKQSSNSPSIDRIDPARGYVPGNVVVVSQRANTLKSDATIAEMQRLVDFYRNLTK